MKIAELDELIPELRPDKNWGMIRVKGEAVNKAADLLGIKLPLCQKDGWNRLIDALDKYDSNWRGWPARKIQAQPK